MVKAVISAFGSWGDLFPLIPIAEAMRKRGHDVTFAVPKGFVEVVAAEGFRVVPVGERLAIGDHLDRSERFDSGPRNPLALRRLWQDFVLAELPETVRELERLCREADVLIAHPAQQAAPLVHASTGIPWVTASMLLGLLPSRYTVPQGMIPWPGGTSIGRSMNAAAWVIGKGILSVLLDGPTNKARKSAGAEPIRNTVFKALSPQLCLWLSSPAYQPRAPDWPSHVRQTGFTYFDAPAAWAEPDDLDAFLAKGEKPLVIMTLGFSAGMNAGDFFGLAVRALRRIGARGVLLGGWPRNLLDAHQADVAAWSFAPLSRLLPHASLVVHPGGYGTTAQVLRAGVPQVVVPWGFDHLFHADSVRRLHVGHTFARRRLRDSRLARALDRALSDRTLKAHAAEMGERLSSEVDGALRACDEIESFLHV